VLSRAGNAPKFKPEGAPIEALNHHQPLSIIPLTARLVKRPSPKYANGIRRLACHSCMTQVRINRQSMIATAYSPPVFRVFFKATKVFDSLELLMRDGYWQVTFNLTVAEPLCSNQQTCSLTRSNCRTYSPGCAGSGTSTSKATVSPGGTARLPPGVRSWRK
jgi:hypothetical protein